jgi:predicted nucleic acid-binding protein
MSDLIVLDASVLGLASNPRAKNAAADACNHWLFEVTRAGAYVCIPEIADYEVRREILRAEKRKGLAKLDWLSEEFGYLPISTRVMRKAAELWAEARQKGYPTATNKSLDADVILAAQAIVAQAEFQRSAVIATTNVDHLSRYIDARLWENIPPRQTNV